MEGNVKGNDVNSMNANNSNRDNDDKGLFVSNTSYNSNNNNNYYYYGSSSGRKLSSGSSVLPNKISFNYQKQIHNDNDIGMSSSLAATGVAASSSIIGSNSNQYYQSNLKTPVKGNKRNTNSSANSSSTSFNSNRKISSTSTSSSNSTSLSPSKAKKGGSHSSQSPPNQTSETPKYSCLDCRESFVKWSHCLAHLRQVQHCSDKLGTPEGRRELQNLCMLKKDSSATAFSLDVDDDFIAAAVAAASLSENNNRTSRNDSRKSSTAPSSPMIIPDVPDFSGTSMMPVSLNPSVSYTSDINTQNHWHGKINTQTPQIHQNSYPSGQYHHQQYQQQQISWIPTSMNTKPSILRSTSPGNYPTSSINSSHYVPSALGQTSGFSQNQTTISPKSSHSQLQQQLLKSIKNDTISNLIARDQRSYSLDEPRGRGLSTSSCVSSPGDLVHADYLKVPPPTSTNNVYKYFCPTCAQTFFKWSQCLQHLRQSQHFGLLGNDNLRKVQALCAIDVRGLRGEFSSASIMDSPQLILQHKYHISNIMRGRYSQHEENNSNSNRHNNSILSSTLNNEDEDFNEGNIDDNHSSGFGTDKISKGFLKHNKKSSIQPITLQSMPDKIAYLVNSFLTVDDMYSLFLALSKDSDLDLATSSRVRTWSGNTVTLSEYDDDTSYTGYE